MSRLSCLIFLVQFGAVLMRHRGNNGRCDTLWTLLLLNGVQEVGGSNPLAPTIFGVAK